MYAITGADGQLGNCLRDRIGDVPAIFVDVNELNITNPAAVKKFFAKHKINLVINCAAYTAVDNAEDDFLGAYNVNHSGAELLARYGRRIIHISTDYVFDGRTNSPYTEKNPANPVSVYGKTKWLGEQSVMEVAQTAAIIRTSALYSEYGNNFVKTMRRLGANNPELKVVNDQITSPTYAGDLADAILRIAAQMKNDSREIYHFSNEDTASWHDFATAIMEISNLKCKVLPIPSSEYPQKAIRPPYSVMDKSKIKSHYGIVIPHWRDSLIKCINTMNK
ncbi:MAG: dTDP-4-dehydrorhamnose reductase [Alphaproteobacteria bacterium]|nr:dTDP-4-dehydrorhamnose reductase [Alphaproteobacteria bacterium]